jgi:hypothetical protein
MKRLLPSPLHSTAALALLVSPLQAQVEHVDPTIGGVALMLVPTRPLVHMPNSMLRVYPVRKDQVDQKISSFPLSIVSHRHGELFALMPGEDGSPQFWDQETTTPYNWDVLHDFHGLIDLMGGPKAAGKKLDELFTKQISRPKYEFWAKFPDSTALVGQFVMANEPQTRDHQSSALQPDTRSRFIQLSRLNGVSGDNGR